MKIRFLVLILCYQTSMAVASPYPFELTVDDLFTKSDSTNDTTYSSIALVRCSALLFFVNELMKRDAGQDLYGKKPIELSNLATKLQLVKLAERGAGAGEETYQRILEGTLSDFEVYVERYSDRMTENRLQTGDYFSNDQKMKSEIATCGQLISEL